MPVRFLSIALFVITFIPLVKNAAAQVPDSISVQGVLTHPGGSPLDTTLDVVFRLYKRGLNIWEETHEGMVFSDGRFNVVLGAETAMDEIAFDAPIEMGIQLTVDGEPEFSPRTPLIPAPYALGMRGVSSAWVGDPSDPGAFAFNIIGGSPLNRVDAGVIGATIGGGGGLFDGTFERNSVNANFGTIGGGHENIVDGRLGVVGGGQNNNAAALWSVVSGGVDGTAGSNASVVAGGYQNTASGSGAVVSGGELNVASGPYSVVPGGERNKANGRTSFAAGRRAQANHTGTFVWADSSGISTNFASSGKNQFLVRASGGVGIGTNQPITQLRVARSFSGAAATENHVALIDNTSTGTSADVLVLRVGRTTNPETTNSFVTFKFNSTETAGFIQGDGTGGVLFTSLGSDYAEFLPSLDEEETFFPGDVVGVHAGRISHRTDGADMVMVVSTSPVVVGNMGVADDPENGSGTRVAFVGQAPVKVVGNVSAGDFLLPSGRNDGTAIAVSPSDIHPDQLQLVFATAWESSESLGTRCINAAIGIDEGAAAATVIEYLHARLDGVLDRLERIEASMAN